MVARPGRRIIRPREWMEIAKNSRKRMCTGGCPTKQGRKGCAGRGKGDPVAITAVTRIDSSCELLCRCSINECRRNGRMCGTVILRNTPAIGRLSYCYGGIINNCVDHDISLLRRIPAFPGYFSNRK